MVVEKSKESELDLENERENFKDREEKSFSHTHTNIYTRETLLENDLRENHFPLLLNVSFNIVPIQLSFGEVSKNHCSEKHKAHSFMIF